MKTRILITLIMLCALLRTEAQSFDDMTKQFLAGRQQMQDGFKNFADSVDRIFVDYLAKSWEYFKVELPVELMLKPEPKEEPVYVPEDSPATETEATEVREPVGQAEVELPAPKENLKVDEAAAAGYRYMNFDFFGTPVRLNMFNGYQTSRVNTNEKQVAEYWLQLSNINRSFFMDELLKKKESLKLNPWGLYRFIHEIADRCFTERQENEKAIFTVFLLNQAGYKAKIGRVDNTLVVLLALRNTVYGKAYIKLESDTYYILSSVVVAGKPIASYKLDYGRARTYVEMAAGSQLQLAESAKSVQRTYREKAYTLKSNKNLIDFYATYPQTELAVYASVPMSKAAIESLETEFRQELAGKSAVDKLRFFLSFIQYGFPYKTDEEQFGYERFFFAEEILSYPFSDCEDRAIFFCRLVKHFCNLDVLLIEYPSHVAAAVRIDEPGDAIVYKGQRYIVCDPTYIGAPIAKTMKGCDNSTAKIVALQ